MKTLLLLCALVSGPAVAGDGGPPDSGEIAPRLEPGSSQCHGGYLVTRCVGSGVACNEEHPCSPPRCTTACEPGPPQSDNRVWSCHGQNGEYRCGALVP